MCNNYRNQLYNKYINNEHFIKSGKEGNTYKVFNQVIKIFHKKRKSPIPRISDGGLICCTTPIETLTKSEDIIGTVENFLEEEELTLENIATSLDGLH
ncbi:MAG: hypothetical protein HFJ12_07690 [Bacilli bacterium]|nr:hypothetical protein [Bacilli bacterium]